MKKCLLFFALMGFLFGSLCYAAGISWTQVTTTKDETLYVDLDSVTSATVNPRENKKLAAKITKRAVNNYTVYWIYVNKQTRQWRTIREEVYDSKGQVISHLWFKLDGEWNSYDDSLWKPVIDKVLE